MRGSLPPRSDQSSRGGKGAEFYKNSTWAIVWESHRHLRPVGTGMGRAKINVEFDPLAKPPVSLRPKVLLDPCSRAVTIHFQCRNQREKPIPRVSKFIVVLWWFGFLASGDETKFI